jgi:hypothetical protein
MNRSSNLNRMDRLRLSMHFETQESSVRLGGLLLASLPVIPKDDRQGQREAYPAPCRPLLVICGNTSVSWINCYRSVRNIIL